MRLRAKTLVAIGAMTAVVGLIVYVALVTNIRGQVTQLEERLTRDNTRRMVNAVERELDSLDTTVSDWSYWDDTYAFAQDGNSQYVDSNLGDDTFTTLGLGVFAIVDLAGQPIFARALDAESGTGVSVPAALATHLSPDGLLRALDPTVDGVKGIVMLDERPLLVVARPILTSLRAGPARGVLIMGRFFDDAFVEHLSNSTEIPVAAARYGDPDLPADFQLASESLGEADSLFVSLLDSRVAAGYALLNDIYGQPTLLLRAETSRDIWQQSIATLRYTIAVLTLLGLISGAAILLFLEFLILAPLTRLSADVARVGAGGDPGARVAETGRDELGRLAQRINGMLHSLQESQDGLRQSEERYRLLIESAHDMIASIAPDGRFLVVNRAWLETMGFPQARCPELHLLDIVHPDSQTACRAAIAAALAGQSPSDLQITLLGANGQAVIVKGNLSGQRHAGSVVAVQLFFRDITLQRQAEEEREILVEAIEQAGEMVVIMGTDRKVRYVNPAFETITGYARGSAGALP